MAHPAPSDRKAPRAGSDVRTMRSLGLVASTVVALALACGPQDALVGAQDPEGKGGQAAAGTGGTGRINTASAGSTAGSAGGRPMAEAGSSADSGSAGATDCEGACQDLPHVKPDAVVACVNGQCLFVQGVCEEGFAHCDGDFSQVGCESDLSDPAHCGQCSNRCSDDQICQVDSGYGCRTCLLDAETACRNECAELQDDRAHCGACGHACEVTEKCSQGACDECAPYRANCGGQNRCDDWLRSAANCGSCGRQCSTVSMTGFCTAGGECQPSACAAGRADCDATPEDCEFELNQAGGCGPQYLGSSTTLAQEYAWWALGPDGSWLATNAGELHKFSAEGELLWTYSAPRGEIRRVALDTDGFVFVIGHWSFNFRNDTADTGTLFAKLNADGEPVWEREIEPVAGAGQAFPGPIAVDGSGTLVMAVALRGQVDVDPTSAVDVQQFDGQWWLFEVDANGAFSWARAFDATGNGIACQANINALARSGGRTLVAGGTFSDCEIAGRVAPPGLYDSGNVDFIASVSPSGSADRVRWLIGAETSGGNTTNDETTLIGYPDGSVALVASINSIATPTTELYFDDLDQQLAVASGKRRFVARLSAELELQWFKVADSVTSPAATANGGLLAIFQPEFAMLPVHPLVTLWREDGSSAWTMPANCYQAQTVGAAGEIFAIRWLGKRSGLNCDLDPGPGVATVAESAMVGTYRF